jgi:hypothetical protein
MENVYRNKVTSADPLRVAQLFAVQNLPRGPSLDTAERIIGLLRDQRFGEAKDLMDDFNRPEFSDGFLYYSSKQFIALLAKVPFAGDTRARQANALKAFWSAERKCKRTNRRLGWFNTHVNRLPETTRVVIYRAKEEIRKVLGSLTHAKLDRLIKLSYPGRGVSIGTRNRFRVSLPYKLGDTDLTSTARALPYARMMVEGSSHWTRLNAVVNWDELTYTLPYATAEGNRITFVPKDARTLRTIAIEPALNVALQLGIHSYIAGRLSVFGNPIDDQGINQSLALKGSLTPLGSSCATIDLSQASDSVSIELVRWLLPSEWFSLLDDFRCHTGSLRGQVFSYEKFSSMGNGFTFALETLIFWALARAVNTVTGGDIASVYGDDIIISDGSALLLTEILGFCGFSVNSAKTYYHGPFRESCGADWHNGRRVTPQYIRKARLRSTDLYNLLNRLDPIFVTKQVRSYCLDCIRESEPIVFGLENEDTSSCLFTPYAVMREKRLLQWKSAWQTWTFSGWVFKPELERVPAMSGLAAALFRGSEEGNMASLRGRGIFRLRSLTPGVTRDLPRWEMG